MPAMMTHDFFGQDAYAAALSEVNLYTPDERDAFMLGNQGPDPLFYLMLTPPLKEFEKLGSDMHKDPPTDIFLRMRKAVDGLSSENASIGRAYLAGFTCHYLLDRAIHPLVFFWERGICQAGIEDLDTSDHSIVHAEIERDFDEMVLFSKRHQTIEEYRPFEQVLRGRDEMLDVLGEVYLNSVVGPLAEGEPTSARVFPLSVKCFRVAQRMFWSPTGMKSDILASLEKSLLKNRYSLLRAMSHRVRAEETSDFDNRERRPWRNPFTGAVHRSSFWDIYNSTLEEVAPSIAVVLGEGFDQKAAYRFTHGLNFSGDPVE